MANQSKPLTQTHPEAELHALIRLQKAGFEVICLEARETAATLAACAPRPTATDARGLAQNGRYRTVHVKSFESHWVRALLAASFGSWF